MTKKQRLRKNEYMKEYRKNHLEYYREYQREWEKRNNSYHKLTAEQKKEKVEYQKAWNKKHREFVSYRNKCYNLGIKPIGINEWRLKHDTIKNNNAD